MRRREFVLAGVAAMGLPRWPRGLSDDVEIVEFNRNGGRVRTVKVPKVAKTAAEWRQQLSAESYRITRERGTERPFSGEYWNLHERGLFHCICCDTALFSSAHKFDSGTGWPSFYKPIAEENVVHGKASPGDAESEVKCRRCDAHLGDLFSDGPKPTGLRYCIDSVALKFARS